MVFLSFHKPQSLMTEKGGGWGLGISSTLAWDMPKKSKFFFLMPGQEIEWKIGGWYEELGFWLRFNLE